MTIKKNKWIKPEIFAYIVEFEKENKRLPKVFISGAITQRLNTYEKYFNEAEQHFKQIGIKAYNPAHIPKDTSWEKAMQITLKNLATCDFMFILKDWEKSKGVKEEIKKAKKSQMKIFFE